MNPLTWQNPEQLFVAQELINKVKSKCCGIKVYQIRDSYWAIGSFVDGYGNRLYSAEDVGCYVVLFDYGQERGVYAFDTKTLLISKYNNTIDFSEIDKKDIHNIYERKMKWLKGLEKKGDEIKNMVNEYLKEAPVLNLTYRDLRDWVGRNCKPSSFANFILAYSAEKKRYFIVGLTEDNKIFAAYCNTLDKNFSDKFGENYILTIKTR